MSTYVHTKFKSDKTGNARINVALRRVPVTNVAVERQKVLHSLSVSVALVI